jgi:hypothetical protein
MLPSWSRTHGREAFVPKTIDPGRGSRRNVRKVRWTRVEAISAMLLLMVLIGEIICIALWLTEHSPD